TLPSARSFPLRPSSRAPAPRRRCCARPPRVSMCPSPPSAASPRKTPGRWSRRAHRRPPRYPPSTAPTIRAGRSGKSRLSSRLGETRMDNSELFRAAREVIAGGVNSPVRAFKGVGGEPVFFERGRGPYLYDCHGRKYIDYVGSWGCLILGHAYGPVIQ